MCLLRSLLPPSPPEQQGIMGVKLDLSLDQNDFAPFTGSEGGGVEEWAALYTRVSAAGHLN